MRSGLAAVLDGNSRLWKEGRFQRAGGSYVHVIDRGRVVRDGRPTRMAGSMRDVTERE